MLELQRKPEIADAEKSDVSAFREIKPESDMTLSEAKSFVGGLFEKIDDASDGFYTSFENREKYTPNGDKGVWEGERAKSKFIPSEATDKGRTAKEKLAEKGIDGIEYIDAEPDFSKCAEATVEIDDMTEHRDDYYDNSGNRQLGNFSQADAKCAEQWNASQKDGRSDWTAVDVRDWRRENRCSWHERCDTRKMDLVSRDIHEFFTHSGGVAECKARDKTDIGGGFDE